MYGVHASKPEVRPPWTEQNVMIRRRLAAAGMLAATAAAAFAIGFVVADAQPAEVHPTPVSDVHPSCPTEDSCIPDYRDGKWHIDPVAP